MRQKGKTMTDSLNNVDEKECLLLVDDNATNLQVLFETLNGRGYDLRVAKSGEDCLEIARNATPALILLDIMMPGIDGFEVCRLLKSDSATRESAIIFLSALDDTKDKVQGFELGAVDYVTKPFQPEEVLARVETRLKIRRLERHLCVRNREMELTHAREVLQREELETEKKRVDNSLHAILPTATVAELKADGRVQPRRYENVAILFADIVGFTEYCESREPEEVVEALHELVQIFDEVCDQEGMQKIKTIGDAFLCVCGLFTPRDNPVRNAVQCGLRMIEATREQTTGWSIRVGIHVGPVVAGLLGSGRYTFDIWGDTVNTAARMETHGNVGAVNVSNLAFEQVKFDYKAESLGMIEVKGKGQTEMFQILSE